MDVGIFWNVQVQSILYKTVYVVSIATMSLYNYFTSKSKTLSKTTVHVAATQVNLTSTEEEEALSALEMFSSHQKKAEQRGEEKVIFFKYCS